MVVRETTESSVAGSLTPRYGDERLEESASTTTATRFSSLASDPWRATDEIIPAAQFSLRRPRRSNGPVERTGGQAGCQVDQALDREAPLGSGESTRTTRNDVDFRNAGDTGCRRRLTRSGNCRIDAVSIGRDQLSSSCCGTVRKGHRKAVGTRIDRHGYRFRWPSHRRLVWSGEARPGVCRSRVLV